MIKIISGSELLNKKLHVCATKTFSSKNGFMYKTIFSLADGTEYRLWQDDFNIKASDKFIARTITRKDGTTVRNRFDLMKVD